MNKSEIIVRGWMKKEFSAEGATYDTFSLSELMSGKYDFHKYEKFEKRLEFKGENNKYIYEGDILKCVCGEIIVVNNIGWNCSCCNGVFGYQLCCNESFYYEIIGNITENPELIKK